MHRIAFHRTEPNRAERAKTVSQRAFSFDLEEWATKGSDYFGYPLPGGRSGSRSKVVSMIHPHDPSAPTGLASTLDWDGAMQLRRPFFPLPGSARRF